MNFYDARIFDLSGQRQYRRYPGDPPGFAGAMPKRAANRFVELEVKANTHSEQEPPHTARGR